MEWMRCGGRSGLCGVKMICLGHMRTGGGGGVTKTVQ